MFEIGNTLREARLRRGLDVTECELGTKIRSKYLRAMEEEHFDLLPSPAYVRGFLRTYAEYLGLDGRLVIDEYESRFAAREHGDQENRRPRSRGPAPRTRPAASSAIRPNRRRTETQLLWLAIGGVMSVALLIWMGVGNPSDSTTPIAGTTPASEMTPERDPDLDTSEAPEPVRITLSGLGPVGSYVEVRRTDENGRQEFAGVLRDGEERKFSVGGSLWVRTYNAEGLRIAVMNRRPRTMSGGTADFVVSRTGVREEADTAAP
jgi:cytoskeleton protein RodZ